jgi:DsbC/DsbD-like thiol-disulfide interchange protein
LDPLKKLCRMSWVDREILRQKLDPRCLILALLVLTSFLSLHASAASLPHGTVDLVAEDRWLKPGHQSYIGLHFQLEKGWHIYWVNPGDSGQPPHAEWSLSQGLTAGEIEWPAPRRLGTSTIVDFGYDVAVTLLVPIRAVATLETNQPAQLVADLHVLVCREICIPGNAHISLSLPIKLLPPEVDDSTRALFIAARKSLPRETPKDWKISAIDANDSFILITNCGREISQALFFPLDESQIDDSAPQKLQPEPTGFHLTLRKSDQLLKPIRRLKGVIEVSANQSYVIDAPVGNAGAAKQMK